MKWKIWIIFDDESCQGFCAQITLNLEKEESYTLSFCSYKCHLNSWKLLIQDKTWWPDKKKLRN